MRSLPVRRWVFAGGFSLVIVSTALAVRPPARTAATRPTGRTTAVAVPAGRRVNPLLPAQADVSGFFPDLAPQTKSPTFAPSGAEPLYTQADWDAYRAAFGADLDGRIGGRALGPAELGAKMLAAAETENRPGVRRLLLVRAVAVTFRNQGGWAIAGRALESYQKTMDVDQPAQVAALWTMTDTLSRYSTVPKPERIKCSVLAAKSNVQLSLQLLDFGQIDAAQTMIRKVTYHEGWIRSETRVRQQIAAARTTINQTATLLDYMAEQYNAVISRHDEAAAFRLYLFAKFVRPSQSMAWDLETRRNAGEIQKVSAALAAAERDNNAAYAAAELLRQTAAELPSGVLKQRTMFAAAKYYRAFLHDPQTETKRVERTLAQMQISALAGDGARGNLVIHPFEAAPATQPAATRPATVTPPRRATTLPPPSATAVLPAVRVVPAAPVIPVTPTPVAPVRPVLPPVHAPAYADGTAEHPLG